MRIRPPSPRSIFRWAALGALACAVVVLLGSCDFRTVQRFSAQDGRNLGTAGDALLWGGVVFFLGAGALGALMRERELRTASSRPEPGTRSVRIKLAAAAGACLAAASLLAGRYWHQLLTEQAAADYVVEIAPGIPVVTVAGTLGTVAAIAFITVVHRRATP